MEINRTGCTRIVFLVGDFAIKVPNFMDGWKLFLNGLLANMQERVFGETKWPKLCPVLFSIAGGWMVVMRRVREMTSEEFLVFDSKSWADAGDYLVPCEHKANSFGWLKGEVVCLDYGS